MLLSVGTPTAFWFAITLVDDTVTSTRTVLVATALNVKLPGCVMTSPDSEQVTAPIGTVQIVLPLNAPAGPLDACNSSVSATGAGEFRMNVTPNGVPTVTNPGALIATLIGAAVTSSSAPTTGITGPLVAAAVRLNPVPDPLKVTPVNVQLRFAAGTVHVVPPPSVPLGPAACDSVKVVVVAAPAANVSDTLNGANCTTVVGAANDAPCCTTSILPELPAVHKIGKADVRIGSMNSVPTPENVLPDAVQDSDPAGITHVVGANVPAGPPGAA